MKLRAYLVDDEPLALERLRRLLAQTGRVELTGSSTEPEQAVAALTVNPPDVCFLDIQMPRLSGFDVLARLPSQPFVIFTSAYDQYALQAFGVNSVDYLLKPVDPELLERALQKVKRLRGAGSLAQPDLHVLVKTLTDLLRERQPEYLDRIASRLGDRLWFLDLVRVTHFYAEDELTYAVSEGKAYCVDYAIAELEKKLDPKKFVRIHRSTLVNVDWIKEAAPLPGGGLNIRLKGGKSTDLTVARDRAREFKARRPTAVSYRQIKQPMRHLAILALLGLVSAHADDRRVPVIVELFTSEGCSSCPPADQLLSRMERSQPVAGARVIALEEHVDYWNSLGWADPFSSSQYRVRQNDYGRRFLNDNIYTPQMIVNGQAQFVGNDSDRAAQEISRAAQTQTTLVELKTSPRPSDSDLVDLAVQVTNAQTGKTHNSNVYLAVTESDLSTNVQRGENSGRLLRHAPVVRSFGVIGKIDSKGSSSGAITNTLRLPREWKRENLRAVVFVQERDSFKITGAAITDLH